MNTTANQEDRGPMSSAEGIPSLLILPASKVSRHLLSKSRGGTHRCIVSIGEPGERIPVGYRLVPSRLRLEFADIVHEREPGILPTAEDIERLIKFASAVAASGSTTIIHCQAGISRSTAAAYIILATVIGPGREQDALAEVVRLVPAAHPNRLMVRLADTILLRRGALLEALEHVP